MLRCASGRQLAPTWFSNSGLFDAAGGCEGYCLIGLHSVSGGAMRNAAAAVAGDKRASEPSGRSVESVSLGSTAGAREEPLCQVRSDHPSVSDP